jgi:hypothetical protein
MHFFRIFRKEIETDLLIFLFDGFVVVVNVVALAVVGRRVAGDAFDASNLFRHDEHVGGLEHAQKFDFFLVHPMDGLEVLLQDELAFVKLRTELTLPALLVVTNLK